MFVLGAAAQIVHLIRIAIIIVEQPRSVNRAHIGVSLRAQATVFSEAVLSRLGNRDGEIDESRRFELRWEVFNTLNHANFLNPTASFSSPNFGRILSARDPRIMQLAAKFYF